MFKDFTIVILIWALILGESFPAFAAGGDGDKDKKKPPTSFDSTEDQREEQNPERRKRLKVNLPTTPEYEAAIQETSKIWNQNQKREAQERLHGEAIEEDQERTILNRQNKLRLNLPPLDPAAQTRKEQLKKATEQIMGENKFNEKISTGEIPASPIAPHRAEMDQQALVAKILGSQMSILQRRQMEMAFRTRNLILNAYEEIPSRYKYLTFLGDIDRNTYLSQMKKIMDTPAAILEQEAKNAEAFYEKYYRSTAPLFKYSRLETLPNEMPSHMLKQYGLLERTLPELREYGLFKKSFPTTQDAEKMAQYDWQSRANGPSNFRHARAHQMIHQFNHATFGFFLAQILHSIVRSILTGDTNLAWAYWTMIKDFATLKNMRPLFDQAVGLSAWAVGSGFTGLFFQNFAKHGPSFFGNFSMIMGTLTQHLSTKFLMNRGVNNAMGMAKICNGLAMFELEKSINKTLHELAYAKDKQVISDLETRLSNLRAELQPVVNGCEKFKAVWMSNLDEAYQKFKIAEPHEWHELEVEVSRMLFTVGVLYAIPTVIPAAMILDDMAGIEKTLTKQELFFIKKQFGRDYRLLGFTPKEELFKKPSKDPASTAMREELPEWVMKRYADKKTKLKMIEEYQKLKALKLILKMRISTAIRLWFFKIKGTEKIYAEVSNFAHQIYPILYERDPVKQKLIIKGMESFSHKMLVRTLKAIGAMGITSGFWFLLNNDWIGKYLTEISYHSPFNFEFGFTFWKWPVHFNLDLQNIGKLLAESRNKTATAAREYVQTGNVMALYDFQNGVEENRTIWDQYREKLILAEYNQHFSGWYQKLVGPRTEIHNQHRYLMWLVRGAKKDDPDYLFSNIPAYKFEQPEYLTDQEKTLIDQYDAESQKPDSPLYGAQKGQPWHIKELTEEQKKQSPHEASLVEQELFIERTTYRSLLSEHNINLKDKDVVTKINAYVELENKRIVDGEALVYTKYLKLMKPLVEKVYFSANSPRMTQRLANLQGLPAPFNIKRSYKAESDSMRDLYMSFADALIPDKEFTGLIVRAIQYSKEHIEPLKTASQWKLRIRENPMLSTKNTIDFIARSQDPFWYVNNLLFMEGLKPVITKDVAPESRSMDRRTRAFILNIVFAQNARNLLKRYIGLEKDALAPLNIVPKEILAQEVDEMTIADNQESAFEQYEKWQREQLKQEEERERQEAEKKKKGNKPEIKKDEKVDLPSVGKTVEQVVQGAGSSQNKVKQLEVIQEAQRKALGITRRQQELHSAEEEAKLRRQETIDQRQQRKKASPVDSSKRIIDK